MFAPEVDGRINNVNLKSLSYKHTVDLAAKAYDMLRKFFI